MLGREGDLHVLSLPTVNPPSALTRLRHVEDGTFRRVRDNGDLGEEFVLEEMPDGRLLMWRNDNFSIRGGNVSRGRVEEGVPWVLGLLLCQKPI